MSVFVLQDLQNQLKKLSGELAERENSLEYQRLEQQEHSREAEHKLQTTIQHLTTSLTHKDQQLQVCTEDFTSQTISHKQNSLEIIPSVSASLTHRDAHAFKTSCYVMRSFVFR